MKSSIEVYYVITSDGKHIGWAKEYPSIVVKADGLLDLRVKIMSSLKTLFSHFINKIDDDTLSVHCKEKL